MEIGKRYLGEFGCLDERWSDPIEFIVTEFSPSGNYVKVKEDPVWQAVLEEDSAYSRYWHHKDKIRILEELPK